MDPEPDPTQTPTQSQKWTVACLQGFLAQIAKTRATRLKQQQQLMPSAGVEMALGTRAGLCQATAAMLLRKERAAREPQHGQYHRCRAANLLDRPSSSKTSPQRSRKAKGQGLSASVLVEH